MPQKYLLFGLVVICFTILLLTWMVRDSLCELQLRQGNIELVAFLACDIKRKSGGGERSPPCLRC
jgi:protein HokA